MFGLRLKILRLSYEKTGLGNVGTCLNVLLKYCLTLVR
jgi:hypothetical protein